MRFGFFVVVAYLIAEVKVRLANERRLARVDDLTGALNPRALKLDAELLMGLARRYQHPLCVAFLDLDGFKAVNDTLGHQSGDAALIEVGATLRRGLRSTDLVGRMGGDEFAIILPETGLQGAREVCARLQADLIQVFEALGLPIGCSTGVAVFEGAPPPIMYEAKRAGRNSVRFRVHLDAPGSGHDLSDPKQAPAPGRPGSSG